MRKELHDLTYEKWGHWIEYRYFQQSYTDSKRWIDRRRLQREQSTQAQLMELGIRAGYVADDERRLCYVIPVTDNEPAVLEMYLHRGAWLFNRDLTPLHLVTNILGWDYIDHEILLNIAKSINNVTINKAG